GFNTMAQSLQATYTELQENNRQLETALGKIQLLERAKEELGRFVPSAVKQLIDEGADSLDGQGEERDVSVLFLDIAGYTQMSEALDQRMVNYLVERYFSAYLDDIYANGGDINETAGDGLMIIFQGDDGHGHAEAAVRTAVAIARKTEDVNQSLGENGYPVRVHIGINSGPASVGLRRFRGLAGERWTYTAAGPTTNVAARIATMAGEGDILIGEETASRVNDVVGLQPLGDFSLKNVAEPVAVYRVVWREEDGFPHGPYSVRSVSDARVDRATMESLR
ncbi:MAG: adenylate/guanylate cyclase domain-containing protein, partial [Anaerolineae bacterium]